MNKIEEEPVLPVVQEADKDPKNINLSTERLRSFIERIERLEEERQGISNDIKDVFAEAKSAGFNVKIIRAIIKLRKMDVASRDEQDFLLDTYKQALDI